MKRVINVYFVTPPLMLRQQHKVTVRQRKDGTEYVVLQGKRFTLDTPDEIFLTKVVKA
jgi:hypothetical protein